MKIKKGLDLPIQGAPEQKIYDAPKITKVAITGPDYNGMKPTMKVNVGEKVKKGQVLFECKKVPGVLYTAPGAGEVIEINRGEKRVFQTIVIKLDDTEEEVEFKKIETISGSEADAVRDNLIQSGLWTAFRTRPFSKAPEIDSSPIAIFVNCMDSNPLGINMDVVLDSELESLSHGLDALLTLTKGNVFVCIDKSSGLKFPQKERLRVEAFEGNHPSGLTGTHMHFLSPVSAKKINWTIDVQDVVSIGKLFKTGRLDLTKVVAFSGPQVSAPRLVKTRAGACLCEFTQDQLKTGETRIVSGSVFHGRTKDNTFCYLSRFANHVTGLAEGREREFLGWHMPGADKFSIKSVFLSKLMPSKKFPFTTTTHGSKRAMVPIGMYEDVMPLDILPTQLLRALCSNDTEDAQKLGALELDEEDLALCTFVDPGKIDYGPILRRNLETIEKEG